MGKFEKLCVFCVLLAGACAASCGYMSKRIAQMDPMTQRRKPSEKVMQYEQREEVKQIEKKMVAMHIKKRASSK